MQWLVAGLGGLLVGFLNGLFGAGGGMVAVPFLKKYGLEAKKAHATSISLILPLCIASAALYLRNGSMTFADAWIYLPGGLIGAVLGALLLKKVKPKWLKRIFGVFILYAAFRMLLG